MIFETSTVAVIVAAGSLDTEESFFYASLLRQNAFYIAVDGGLKLFHDQNFKPDLFLGDMDSINPKDMEWACIEKIPQKRFPCDKDKTDTHLALDIAIEYKKDPIYILGATGSRLDHTLGNLYLLVYAYQKGVDAKILNPWHQITLLTPSCKRILKKQYGEIVSVLPVSSIIHGLTMEGFQWNLQEQSVAQGLTWTISNSLKEEQGNISLKEGIAFIIQVRNEN